MSSNVENAFNRFSGTEYSTPQNATNVIGLTVTTTTTIKQETFSQVVVGLPYNSLFHGANPVPVTLSEIKVEQPEENEGLGNVCDPPLNCEDVESDKSTGEQIGDSGHWVNDPVLGLVKLGDPFNLDLSMSLEDTKNLNFRFEELATLVNVPPDFDDNAFFDFIRKDFLSAFKLPHITVEIVCRLLETDVETERIKYAQTKWQRVKIGTYLVQKSNPGFLTDCTISRYGLIFSVPHTKADFREPVKICVPITKIMDFRIFNGEEICVLGFRTGSSYAAWLRSAIGMQVDDPKEYGELSKATVKQLPSLFYGPIRGNVEQKWIILVVDKFLEVHYNRLKSFFVESNGNLRVCNFSVMSFIEAKIFVVKYNVCPSEMIK